MNDPLYLLILLAMGATVVVLALGIGGYAKGGENQAKRSNKMMRLRILFQFVAVILIVLYVYLRQTGGQ